MARSTFSRVVCDCGYTKLTLLLTGLVLLGCGGREEVRHYKVPKPELVYAENHVDAAPATAQPGQESTEPTDRLLGAIVPRAAQTWYFKMTGPMELVARQEPAFGELISSLTFDGPNAEPKWTLPDSWTEDEGTGERLATLSVETEGQKLEVSVIQLATSPSVTSILDNVNRWRRQMQLPPIAAEQLATKTSALSLSDGTAILVNLVGNFSSGSMGSASLKQPPRTSAQPPATKAPATKAPVAKAPAATAEAKRAGLQYETPAGWAPQKPVMFSVLTLGLEDGARSVQITVSSLKGDGGGLLLNVNRWNRQAGVPAITEAELAQRTETMEVGEIKGTYAEAIGDNTSGGKAVLGWVGPQGDQSWFVKISGDPQMVRQQRETFHSFLKTLKFNAP